MQKELKKLTNEIIASLTGWQFILEAISVAEFEEIGIRDIQKLLKPLPAWFMADCPRHGSHKPMLK